MSATIAATDRRLKIGFMMTSTGPRWMVVPARYHARAGGRSDKFAPIRCRGALERRHVDHVVEKHATRHAAVVARPQSRQDLDAVTAARLQPDEPVLFG